MGAFFAFLGLAVIATMVYNFTKSGSGGPAIVHSATGFGTSLFQSLVGA